MIQTVSMIVCVIGVIITIVSLKEMDSPSDFGDMLGKLIYVVAVIGMLMACGGAAQLIHMSSR
jgi:hypothetical protein